MAWSIRLGWPEMSGRCDDHVLKGGLFIFAPHNPSSPSSIIKYRHQASESIGNHRYHGTSFRKDWTSPPRWRITGSESGTLLPQGAWNQAWLGTDVFSREMTTNAVSNYGFLCQNWRFWMAGATRITKMYRRGRALIPMGSVYFPGIPTHYVRLIWLKPASWSCHDQRAFDNDSLEQAQILAGCHISGQAWSEQTGKCIGFSHQWGGWRFLMLKVSFLFLS